MESHLPPDAAETHKHGQESVVQIGDLWVVGTSTGAMPDGTPVTNQMTLGYDPQRGKFVGSWVGSVMTYHFVYEGELDETGTRLHLYNEGPSFTGQGTETYRDTIEMVDDDTRYLRSHHRDAEGQWVEFMCARYERVA